jgi:hypothetical protein
MIEACMPHVPSGVRFLLIHDIGEDSRGDPSFEA